MACPRSAFSLQRECGDERAEEMERATTAERRRRLKRPAETSEAPLSSDCAATTRKDQRRGSCAAASSVADSERPHCHNPKWLDRLREWSGGDVDSVEGLPER